MLKESIINEKITDVLNIKVNMAIKSSKSIIRGNFNLILGIRICHDRY